MAALPPACAEERPTTLGFKIRMLGHVPHRNRWTDRNSTVVEDIRG